LVREADLPPIRGRFVVGGGESVEGCDNTFDGEQFNVG
jgi:hypothetical protein